MRRLWRHIFFLSLCCGCASDRGVVLIARPERSTPNLLLSPWREDARAAEAFAVRSDWPSTSLGYEYETYEEATQFIYDDQSFYDRIGGGLYHTGSSVRFTARRR